jgi:DNA-binding NtrC family response regulator
LKETKGTRTEAARRLGMSRRTLHRKLREYKLDGDI